MPLSGKQKKEKKKDKKKKTREGKIEKRTTKMTLDDAMGTRNHTEYDRMRRQFRSKRQTYRERVAAGTENINFLELKELLQLREELLTFLISIENLRIVSGKTKEQQLVKKTRLQFDEETDSKDKLLKEPPKKEVVVQQPEQNEKDPVEEMVEEKKQSDASSSSSDESSSNEEPKYYMILELWPDGTYSIRHEADYKMEKLEMNEIAPTLYGNVPLNNDDPISKWMPFLIGKYGEDEFSDDGEEIRAPIEFTLYYDDEDMTTKQRERAEELFADQVKAYAIKTFGRDTDISG
jgi:hypothetical protein